MGGYAADRQSPANTVAAGMLVVRPGQYIIGNVPSGFIIWRADRRRLLTLRTRNGWRLALQPNYLVSDYGGRSAVGRRKFLG